MNTDWRTGALAACRLLGDAINGRKTNISFCAKKEPLLDFSEAHRITTLISSAIRASGIPDDRYSTLHSAAAREVFHQVKSDLTAASARERLEAAGIPLLQLKGAAVQAVYPTGWIRTTTDTDFLIKAEQISDTCAILTAMGFTKNSEHDGDVCFLKPPRTVIELHTSLGGYSKKQQNALRRLADTPFGVHEHYVYTLFHLYKHILYAGAGVRLFLDMYCLDRAVTDRAYVKGWLEELDLLSFDDAVHRINDVLFDGTPCTADLEETIDFVLMNGTFGTGENYFAIHQATRSITERSRFRTRLYDYGFDLRAMTKRYPVLQQRRWLYPFCAVHRIAHGILHKRAVLRHVVQLEHAADRRQLERVLRAMQIL